MPKLKTYKVVEINFQDHSGDLEGEAAPFYFKAVGILLKETKEGFILGHWARLNNFEEGQLGEITSYIAKVHGMTIKTIAKVALNG